jgi:beta-barrel assembly-enhancing protease
MNGPVNATYYGDDASKPHAATVEWRSAQSVEVRLADRTETWDLRSKGCTWEISAGSLRITHGSPAHTVIITDAATISAWRTHFKTHRIRKSTENRVPWLLTLPFALPLGFIALCVGAYFWLLPYVSERMAMALPPEMDAKLGDPMFEGMKADLTIDEAGSATLEAFADKLVIAPTFKLRLHLVKDGQVNAFAMPGGHIVVYTGILDKMKEPGELAALLAHEGTHVEKRHSTRGIARDLSGSLFLSLLFGDLGGLAGAVAQKGDELKGLSYSRDLETEADTIGIRRMHANGVDPQGMVKLLELLEREAEDMPEGASFLSSHPLTKDRLSTAQAKAAELGRPATPAPQLDSLFQAMRSK